MKKRTDKERLDWLENSHGLFLRFGAPKWIACSKVDGRHDRRAHTAREAIDKVMAADSRAKRLREREGGNK